MKKIIVECSLLSSAIAKASRFCPKKPMIPIMGCLKIDINEDKCTLLSFDNENSISYTFNVENYDERNFSFCMPMNQGVESFLKTLGTEVIALIVDENNTSINIQYSKGASEFPIMPSSEFMMPTPNVEYEHSFQVKGEVINRFINNGKGFCSSDELRPIMCGAYLEVRNSELTICTTDAHQMFVDKDNCTSTSDFSFVINQSVFPAVCDVANNNEYLTFEIGERNISISSEDTIITCRSVEGRFPNFRAVIPDISKANTRVRFVTKGFISAVNRVAITAQTINPVCVLDIKDSTCETSSEDLDYNKKSKEKVDCEVKGNDLKIGLNAKSLSNMLSVIDNEKFVMYITESNKPIILMEQDKPNKILLITPMVL